MQQPKPDIFRVVTLDKYTRPLLSVAMLSLMFASPVSSYALSIKIALPLALVALAVALGLAVMRYLTIAKVFATGDTVEAYINQVGFGVPVLRSRRAIFMRPRRTMIRYTYLVGEKSYQMENWIHINAVTRKWQRGDMVKVSYDPEQPEQAFIVDVFA